MTTECQTDAPLEDKVLSFTGERWPMRRHKLSMSTRLAQDLGMEGDDAVAFFKEFGQRFNVDLAALHVRWGQHLSPEGSGSFGAVVVLCLCITAGFWVHDLVGLLPAWGWGIALAGVAFFIYQRWVAKKMLPITIEDLVESARSGRWVKLYPDGC